MATNMGLLSDDCTATGAANRSDGWGRALLAALPHLLVTAAAFPAWLLIQLHIWGGSGFPEIGERFFVGLIVVLLVAAGLRRWPRWSGRYAGYGCAILLFVLLQGLTDLFQNLPATRQYSTVLETGGILGWLGLSLVVVWWLARRDMMGGLLAVLPVTPMALALVGQDETRGGEPVFLAIALFAAAAAFLLARVRRPAVGLWLVVAANVAASAATAYHSTYHSTTMRGEPSLEMVVPQMVAFLVIVAILLAPVGLLLGWRQRKRPNSRLV